MPSGSRHTSKKASSAKRSSSTKKPSSAYSSSKRSASTPAKSRATTHKAAVRGATAAKRRSVTSPRKDKHSSQWMLTIAVAGILIIFFWYLFIQPNFAPSSYNPDAPYSVDIPSGYGVHGIDISHHQGDIDWEQLATTRQGEVPISFIFIKATEGGDHKDNLFDANFVHAAEAGFLRGAYHFYNPATDPVRQADFFIANVTLAAGDLPPVIDIEVKPSRQQLPVFYAQLSTFLYRLEAHYGITPILYTSYKYKERYLSDSLFDRYPLWIAHYHVDALEYKGAWTFWQHTDRAVIPGIPEKTDLNVFHGTLKDLQKITLQK